MGRKWLIDLEKVWKEIMEQYERSTNIPPDLLTAVCEFRDEIFSETHAMAGSPNETVFSAMYKVIAKKVMEIRNG